MTLWVCWTYATSRPCVVRAITSRPDTVRKRTVLRNGPRGLGYIYEERVQTATRRRPSDGALDSNASLAFLIQFDMNATRS